MATIITQKSGFLDDQSFLDKQDSAHDGKVYIVGAGPGDPDLITLKGLRCLRLADVVLYDRLISPALLAEMRPEATRIFVGKTAQHHTMEQGHINALLVAYARQGYTVVRLKGGDPFVFGRGGEEALTLAQAGISYEIVPGISSAVAVPAYAGIPVTHRDYTSSVTIVTGHESGSNGSPGVNWEALAHLGGTLIVLMGVKALPRFTQRLVEHGADPAQPAVVIQEGTTPRQRIITGTLADIAERATRAELGSPALTIIGPVVSLSDVLAWYKTTEPLQAQAS